MARENPGGAQLVPLRNDVVMALVSARDLSVRLANREILHRLTFSLEAGTFIGVLGPNGSGKTTLLRALAGLIAHTGSLTFDGRALRAWTARDLARRVAVVRQSFGLGFDYSVDELVLLGRAPHKSLLAPYDREDRRLVAEALAAVDLEGFESRSVLTLSGGEQRRVLLAQALVQQADLLLLDEPTTYLDVHHRYEFLDHIVRLVRGGVTAVGVFHELETAARYADSLLVLRDGAIVAHGTPAEVLTSDLVARVFLMQARIGIGRDQRPDIRFMRPISRPRRNGTRPAE